jgi:hypothetical protein
MSRKIILIMFVLISSSAFAHSGKFMNGKCRIYVNNSYADFSCSQENVSCPNNGWGNSCTVSYPDGLVVTGTQTGLEAEAELSDGGPVKTR